MAYRTQPDTSARSVTRDDPAGTYSIMPQVRRNEPIASFEDGDTVSGFALLARKELRQDRNARDYLDLELVDASGSIVGKVWSDSRALGGDYEAQDFVAYHGTVSTYRERPQLNVKECRRAGPEDERHGFDPARLIPTTPYDVGELYQRLERLLEENLERPELSRLAAETLAAHGAALREHPAAKSIHHAYRGGLLEHVVSMAEVALAVAGHYPQLDRDLLLVGVLFHDLGKLIELESMPAAGYTPAGRLVGHVVLGRDLLCERCRAIPDFPTELQQQLEHLVLSHQGRLEYGSPVPPMTPEAIALHFIDDLDSKLNQLERARQSGAGFQYVRGLGRYVYLQEEEEAAERGAAPDETGGEKLQVSLDL